LIPTVNTTQTKDVGEREGKLPELERRTDIPGERVK